MIDAATVSRPPADLRRQAADDREALRRLRLELASAGVVQSRLLRTAGPAMATLRYAGSSVAARGVGGDYYDFLDGGPGRLGIVIGDVAGKGLPAAILMAGLQGHLRSGYGRGGGDLRRLMESVNREFGRCTEESRFATLFTGEYDDATHTLRYANAGQGPLFVLRASGAAERPGTTGTVLGLFPEWKGSVAEVVIAPGDTVLLVTDGLTEAADEWDEPFGEDRLLAGLRAFRHLPPDHVCRALQRAVRRFSPGERSDDRTVVVLQGLA
jgi:sigma-B regulation protein RsbU (phosphoserine phosphatase)